MFWSVSKIPQANAVSALSTPKGTRRDTGTRSTFLWQCYSPSRGPSPTSAQRRGSRGGRAWGTTLLMLFFGCVWWCLQETGKGRGNINGLACRLHVVDPGGWLPCSMLALPSHASQPAHSPQPTLTKLDNTDNDAATTRRKHFQLWQTMLETSLRVAMHFTHHSQMGIIVAKHNVPNSHSSCTLCIGVNGLRFGRHYCHFIKNITQALLIIARRGLHFQNIVRGGVKSSDDDVIVSLVLAGKLEVWEPFDRASHVVAARVATPAARCPVTGR